MKKNWFVHFESHLLTERRVASNTFNAYKSDLDQFAQFLNTQNKQLESLKAADLKEFLHHLISQHHVGARSMARKISTLRLFFTYLHEHAGLHDIGQTLHVPKLEKKLPHYLTEDEMKDLLKAADRDTSNNGVRNKVMLYLLYVTGMRISELIQLHVSDISFDTSLVSITGKGGRQRMVPLPEFMLKMLKEYLDTIHKTFIKNNKDKNATRFCKYLFPILYAGVIKPITRQSFWMILKHVWEKTGSKKTISPHQLRHSVATHMLKRGADLRSLQLLLGHENIATVQIYTHLEKSHVRTIYDKKHPRS